MAFEILGSNTETVAHYPRRSFGCTRFTWRSVPETKAALGASHGVNRP